jgi:hypothetical protein
MKIYLQILLLTFSKCYSQTSETFKRKGKGVSEPIQDSTKSFLQYKVFNGDTLKVFKLEEVIITSPRIFARKRDQNKYNRLVYNVKKVYPYAKLAGEKLRYYEFMMQGMNDRDRKKFTKRLENELNDEFGDELKNLNFTQGRILLKLLDRETKSTPYELVADLRGSFRAFFWNGLAGIFGYNLKDNYDPVNIDEDKYIEEIVQMINLGVL